MISKHTIDRVFETARLEEVIGEFVQLKKSGSNFKGLSPFTKERTPSFMVSPVKQIWKDFSSGKGGNVISFLMEHEHYSYPEAIKWVAKKYNIDIEETEQTDEQKQQQNERESMFLVSNFAKEYFQEVLHNDERGKAIGLSYFKERGFREDTIKKFELGYCLDDWDAFTKEALDKGYQLKYLESTGLTINRENKTFDRFKGRVMFPIQSMSGRVLGFGGRILTSSKKVAKYVNSPESDIYQKSKVLYGIYHSKKEIAKKDNCYLVEGYTDVISFHQSGIENVVASSGTALTPDQIRIVNRLTKNITVLFDGDDAGIRASLRGIDLILEQGMNVKVVQFPDGEDPDSFAKSHSSSELEEFLQKEAKDFINFKVSLLLKDASKDPIKRAAVIREIVVSISKIPDRIQQEVYIKDCSRILDISEQVLYSELAQISSKKQREASQKRPQNLPPFEGLKPVQVPQEEINQLSILEKEIIRILLVYGNEDIDFTEEVMETDDNGKEKLVKRRYKNLVSEEIYLHLHEDEIEFSNPIFQEIYAELIHQLNQSKQIDFKKLLNHSNPEVVNKVTSIVMDEEKYQLSNWESKNIYVSEAVEILPKLVMDAVFNLRRVLISEKVGELMQSENPEIDLEIVKGYIELKKKLYQKLNRVV